MFVLVFGSIANASAAGSFSSVTQSKRPTFQASYTNNQRSTYWPILDEGADCEARNDLILQVAPFGCQPTTVPSQLLAEQNVPVFCQVDALQINPLIDIEEIENIRFTGEYPEEVVGAGFHPARAALTNRDVLIDGPLISNIGYVVVVLKKTENEDNQPDFVNVNLTAQVSYESGFSVGIGRAEFKLEEITSKEWENNTANYAFWNGRYFIKLDYLDEERADVSIYKGDQRIVTKSISRGETTDTIYVPGTYCQTGLRLRFNNLELQEDSVVLDLISDDVRERFVGYVGSRFLNNKCRILDISEENGEKKVTIRCGGSSPFDLNIADEGPKESENLDFNDNGAEDAFEEAIAAYGQVVQDYPSERDADVVASEYYGEIALLNAIKLADEYGQYATRDQLISELKNKYPAAGYYIKGGENDESGAFKKRTIDNKDWTIKLSGIDILSEEDKPKAVFTFGSVNQELSKGDKIDISEEEAIEVTSLDIDSVTIKSTCEGSELRNERMEIGDSRNTCERALVLKNIEARRVASVSVIPQTRGTESESNLSVNIGIAKRDIDLSPERAQRKADKLNETIEKFENINERLTSVVEKLKAACFAVSAALTVKNLVLGFTGESLARKQVMSGAGGWTQRCAGFVAEGEYRTLDACYADKSDEIDAAVDERKDVIQKVNKNVDEFEDEIKEGFLDSVDSSELRNKYEEDIVANYGSEKIGDETVKELLEESDPSISQLRNLQTNLELKGSTDTFTSNRANNDLTTLKVDFETQISRNKDISAYNEIGITPTVAESSEIAPTRSADIKTKSEIEKLIRDVSLREEDSVNGAIVSVKGDGDYLVGLDDDGNVKELNPVKIEDGKIVSRPGQTGEDKLTIKKFKENVAGQFVKAEYNNPIESAIDGNVKVKYFETEPYKGMPALVPFDKQNGWYVQTRQTLPVLGGQKSFDSSGRPASFYICNVGKDGSMDGLENDECRLFNVNTATTYGTFPGLTQAETKSLVQRAIKALREAAEQYGQGTVTISGEDYDLGKAADIPATQCQNFMSPDDCQLLFNVCDPVICPSSRCDFGGKYPVADVIQTGIVGSTLLCMPNFKLFGGDVYIPVCLSGINAGIEGYLSILKGYQSCLIERATSGKLVGLCDEVHAINLCEFFWRQMAPLVKVLIPRLVEFAYGQSEVNRGGGEYATVQAAWENAQGSIRYMTQEYAVNSLRAFQFGSIEEVGTQFCRASASGSFPTSFETLVQADSPTQFHAWFSSTRFNDATVPATATYKVFYHIYAGRDQGVYYNVYLKSPPEFASVSVPSAIQVDSGFIGQGETIQESKDFTAPEGYKELCISVNGRESCGFNSVSTSLASNVLSDSFVQSQAAESDITSESTCISGSPSLGALFVSGNPQSAGEAAINPEIYNRGIVRICSTSNPGEGTNPGRYKNVGYCDNENVRCWLDTQSVNDAISDQNAGQLNLSSITSLDALTKESLEKEGKFRYTDSIAIVAAVEKEVDNLNPEKAVKQKDEKLKEIENVMAKLVLNHHKARLLLTKAKLLDKVARSFDAPEKVEPPTEEQVAEEADEVSDVDEEASARRDSGAVPSPGEEEEIKATMKEEGDSDIVETTKPIDEKSAEIIDSIFSDDGYFTYTYGGPASNALPFSQDSQYYLEYKGKNTRVYTQGYDIFILSNTGKGVDVGDLKLVKKNIAYTDESTGEEKTIEVSVYEIDVNKKMVEGLAIDKDVKSLLLALDGVDIDTLRTKGIRVSK